MDNKPVEKRSKGANLFIIFLLIAATLCIVGGLAIILSSSSEKKNNEKEIDVTSPEAITAYDAFNSIYISPENLYASDTYNIKQISNHDLVASITTLLDDTAITFCPTLPLTNDVSIALINSMINSYIQNKSIDVEMIKKVGAAYPNALADVQILDYGIKIMDENTIRIAGPCSKETPEFQKVKKLKATETDTDIHIYTKIAFGKYVAEDKTTHYYKTYSKKGKIVETFSPNAQGDNSPDYHDLTWDSYNTYKFTFKKGKESYYFEQLELINE